MSISRKIPGESALRPRKVRHAPESLAIADSTGGPRLLVSVRSVSEASDALAGGADLIDIKEPHRGSLGFAGLDTVIAIERAIAGSPAPRPALSVALGELSDWNRLTPIPALPGGVSFAKVGLSGCRTRADWVGEWTRLRSQFDARATRPLSWIAVHYVDSDAGGPSLGDVLAAAARTGCAGVLLDTFNKAGGRLFDHVAEEILWECRESARRSGIMLALAGSLLLKDAARLARLAPDIVAARGAVCAGGDRAGMIDPHAVGELRISLSQASRLA